MSAMSRIAKIFGVKHKESIKQTVDSTPVAFADEPRTCGRIEKQISLESTSSYATTNTSTTCSSASHAGTSFLDTCPYTRLEAIASVDSFLEEPAIEEKSAAVLVLPPSSAERLVVTEVCSSFPPIVLQHETLKVSDVASASVTHPVDRVVDLIDPPSVQDASLAIETRTESSLEWRTLSWAEVFSSDSTSSSLCDLAQHPDIEQTPSEGTDGFTSDSLQSVAASPTDHHSTVAQNLADVHDPLTSASSDSPPTSPTSSSSSTLTCIGEEDEAEDQDLFSEAQDRTTSQSQQIVSTNPFIMHVLNNAPPSRRYYRGNREEVLADFLSVPVILEEDGLETDWPTLRDDPEHTARMVNPSAAEEASSLCDTQREMPLQWKTLSWAQVFSSDSASSSIYEIAKDSSEEQAYIEDQTSTDESDVESLYIAKVCLYHYAVEPQSFGEAAKTLFMDDSDRLRVLRTSKCSSERECNNIHEAASETSNSAARDRSPEPIHPDSTNPSLAQWPVLSWADVFSSDSTSSSLCDIATHSNEESNVNASDAPHSVNASPVYYCPMPWQSFAEAAIALWSYGSCSSISAAPASSTPSAYIMEDDEDEDPFSEEQDRSFEQKQHSASTKSFIAHVLENASPIHCYRRDRDAREDLLSNFMAIPTIFEEDEDPTEHVRASVSHDSLLAVDSDPFEFNQVSFFRFAMTMGSMLILHSTLCHPMIPQLPPSLQKLIIVQW